MKSRKLVEKILRSSLEGGENSLSGFKIRKIRPSPLKQTWMYEDGEDRKKQHTKVHMMYLKNRKTQERNLQNIKN